MINQLNNFITLRKSFLNHINKIEVLRSEIQDDIYSDLPLLKYARMNNINELLDELLDYLWNMIYGENREKNEISNIDIDMNNDIDRYVSKYINIVNDKSELVNKMKELLDSFMLNIGRETSYDIIEIKMREWQVNIQNLIKDDGAKNDEYEVDRITRITRDQLSDSELIDDEVINFDKTIERLLNDETIERFLNDFDDDDDDDDDEITDDDNKAMRVIFINEYKKDPTNKNLLVFIKNQMRMKLQRISKARKYEDVTNNKYVNKI